MQDRLFAAIIPLDGYTGPIRFNDGTLVGVIVLPAYLVADLERSGLIADHGFANSTRFIPLWPVKLLWPSSHLIVT